MSARWLEVTNLQREIIALTITGASEPKIASTLLMPESRVRKEIENFMLANQLTTREQVGALAVRAGIA